MTAQQDQIKLGRYTLHPGVLAPELVPIDQLKDHPRNSRKGDVGNIQESMDTNGVYRPVIAQRSTGYLIAGNHSTQSLRAGGATEAVVVWLDVDDEQALRILEQDNGSADRGYYDDLQKLANLQALVETDLGLAGSSYDQDYLAELEAALAETEEQLTPDQFKEYGDDIETTYGCPSCGYEWSGSPHPGKGTHSPPEPDGE